MSMLAWVDPRCTIGRGHRPGCRCDVRRIGDEPIVEETVKPASSCGKRPSRRRTATIRDGDRHDDETIVRLTADCPLLDPKVVAMTVAAFEAGDVDYLSTIRPRSLPRGLDVEVFSRQALLEADRAASGYQTRPCDTVSVREWPLLCRWIGLRSRRFELQSHGRHGRRSLSRGSDCERTRWNIHRAVARPGCFPR